MTTQSMCSCTCINVLRHIARNTCRCTCVVCVAFRSTSPPSALPECICDCAGYAEHAAGFCACACHLCSNAREHPLSDVPPPPPPSSDPILRSEPRTTFDVALEDRRGDLLLHDEKRSGDIIFRRKDGVETLRLDLNTSIILVHGRPALTAVEVVDTLRLWMESCRADPSLLP